MDSPLVLPRVAYDQIIAHCRSAYPKEACGLLAGMRVAPTGRQRAVMAVYPMRNVDDSPIGYSMDPKEQLMVEKQMRQRDQILVGIYHSHTATEARPSSVDVTLAISPEVAYVVVSLRQALTPELRTWHIDGATVTEEPWTLEDVAPGRSAGGRA